MNDENNMNQERRAKEKKIEEAKKAVQKAIAEKRKPDPELMALAGEKIAPDETEEGQATQDCEVESRTDTCRLR